MSYFCALLDSHNKRHVADMINAGPRTSNMTAMEFDTLLLQMHTTKFLCSNSMP